MSVTKETRCESYEAVKPSIIRRQVTILDILGDSEMTASEIAEILYIKGFTPFYERNFAAPRLTELKASGKVEAIGKRLCEKIGRKNSVWKKRC